MKTIHVIEQPTKPFQSGTARSRAWRILQAFDGLSVDSFVNACRVMEEASGVGGDPAGWVKFFTATGRYENRPGNTNASDKLAEVRVQAISEIFVERNLQSASVPKKPKSGSPKELKFKILAGKTHFNVVFYLGTGYVNADCDCPAGKYGNFCQHRLRLLRGDGSQIAGDNLSDLTLIVESLPGTRLESALSKFERLAKQVNELREKGPSTELDEIEIEFKAARKELSFAMMS
jgi:hypothetical protein